MSEQDIRAERLKKLEILKSAGMEGYPARTKRDISIADCIAKFEALEKAEKQVTIAGRVMSLRGQGGIMFADVFDGSTSPTTGGTHSTSSGQAGRIQVVLQAESVKNIDLFEKVADAGDFFEFRGSAFKTKRGQPSLKVTGWQMLAKSLLPIPAEHFGIKDEELRLRERDVDILLTPELRAMIERRAKFWQAIRDFYLARGFTEVETPVLETSPGGADARPFITHHNALDIDVYLRISCGELWQKRLLIAGFSKVFEIGRIFRNEGQSREHLQDYTQLESYEAFSDVQAGKKHVQELYRHIAKEVYGKYTFEIGDHTVDFAEEWDIVDFCAAVKKEFGIDALSCSEKEAIQAVRDAKIQFGLPAGASAKAGETLNKARAVDHLWKHVRKGIAGPAFLTGVPVFLEPLAKRSGENADVVERVQIIIAGSEVGKGYSELNDPQDQRARFEEQEKLRKGGDEEAQRLDEDYIRAMEYGMPPAFGFGVSERLFAFLENKPAHETQLFPLLRPRSL